MRSIEEGYLRFEFGSEWDHVEQWDKTTEFGDGIARVQGVKALDIIALSKKNKECLLLEIKDFRDQNDEEDGARKTSGGRTKGQPSRGSSPHPGNTQALGNLVEQVANKVAGTVAGVVGVARSRDQDYATEIAKYLTTHKSQGLKVRVVLWVEGRPTSRGTSARAKPNLGAMTQSLKRKVNWLTARPVAVLSSASQPGAIPDLKVIDSRP